MYKRVSIAKTQLGYMYKTCSYYPQLLNLLFILSHYCTFNVMFIFSTLLVLNKLLLRWLYIFYYI